MKIETHNVGPAEARALVFIHGFMGSGADFEAIAAELGGRFRCVLVDLPGHGRASLPGEPLSMAALAEALCEQVLAPLDDPIVLGYSMGGRLALQASLDHPEFVGQTVLVSTSPGISEPQARQARRRADRRRAARIRDDFDAFLRDWYRLELFGDLCHSASFAATRRRRRRNDADDMARVIVELSPGRQPSNWARVGELEHVTWLVGDQDVKYLALGDRLRQRGQKVVVCPKAAHSLHLERPAWLADWLRCL